MSTEAVETVRPLNATQSRALAKLVKNDAEQLRTEIQQQADKLCEEAEARIRAEWAERIGTADEWVDKADAIVSRYNASRQRLIREARDAGVTLDMPTWRYSSGQSTAGVDGLDRAIRDAKEKVWAKQRQATSALRRHELTLERRVLEASITAQAQNILDSLPSAADLMRGADQPQAIES